MKYLVVKFPDGAELPVLFPAPMAHSDLADILCAARGAKPVGAGFCRLLSDGRTLAFGYSESLGIGARRQDAELIGVMARVTL